MTQVFEFSDYNAQFQQLGEVVQAILAKQQTGVVWITLHETARWKLTYAPISKIAECHHKGGDNFLTIAKIREGGAGVDLAMSKFVRLSNYEKDLRTEEPTEFARHLEMLEAVLPLIIEIDERLGCEGK